MANYAGIEDTYAAYDRAAVTLQSIPYDGTSTWGKGADKGFEAFMDASANMELYDIETGTEVYRQGVHILPAVSEKSSPEAMFRATYAASSRAIQSGKFPTFFGGEHSISIGLIKAFRETYKDLTVLQLDAHTDLRPEYMGTPYNHACALYDASQHCNLVQVGIRSMDNSENEFLNRRKCFFAADIHGYSEWMKKALKLMTKNVYITVDLDVFDPSILPGTGTPEPGGLDWYTVTAFLRKVFRKKNVVGFDIVELAPLQGNRASEFLTAKLYYKMLSYKFS